MSNDWFFEKFALISDAPGAVERMRGLVLHMAVQGRLVPQLTTDDPVELLIVAIASDRAAFVKGSGLSRQRELDEVTKDLVPFALPRGWVWTRLGKICRVQAGFAFKSAAFVQSDKGIPIIRIRDITQDHTQVNYLGDYREEFLVNTGDFLVGMDGNFTVAKWRGRRALLNQRVSRLQWYSKRLEPTFFAIAAQHQLTELQGKKAYTTVDHLSSKQIEEAVVPLPPLAEQTRIVAKVDELMGICDALEAQQQERESRKSLLVRASLSRFAESPTPENLGYLFHNSYDIPPSELRKSILTLAVQGKLVPQDPNDEPSEFLVERITTEKSALVNRKLTRSSNSHTSRDIDRIDGRLPDGWAWVQVDQIASVGTGSTPLKSERDYYANGDIPWVTSASTNNYFINEPDQFVTRKAQKDYNLRIYPKGSLLIALYGQGKTRGQVGQLMFDSTTNQACAVLEFFESGKSLRDYIRMFFLKKYDELRERAAGAAQPNLSGGMIRFTRVPLPPLAEQRRIVDKVDQLMALVNELERQQETSRENASKLLDAIVQEMTSGGRDIAATLES